MEGKVAFITGSTSGFGLATAQALAKRGCSIIVTGFGDPVFIQSLIQDIKGQCNVKVDHVGGDLRNVDSIATLCQEIHDLYPEGIDILINNAGFNHVCDVVDYPDEMWDDMVALMLSAPFHLIKRLAPKMKEKRWGRIVNVSSQMAFISAPGKAVYSAVKAGLVGLTKGTALELAKYDITCNAVCPSFALSPIVEEQARQKAAARNISHQEAMNEFSSSVPTGKFVTQKQVADLIEFLVCSEASSQMTGGAYLIDGGFTSQ